jgi:aspartyl protease family protein
MMEAGTVLGLLLASVCASLPTGNIPTFDEVVVAAVQEQPVLQPAVLTLGVPADEPLVASPHRVIVFGPPKTADGSEVLRAADGLFYVTAIVNGAPVRFLLDTGASMVVLTPEDARRAGVAPEQEHFTASAETANGRTSMARVMLDEIIVGDKHVAQVGAAVVQDNLKVSLLGQSWLSRLKAVTITGDRMVLN